MKTERNKQGQEMEAMCDSRSKKYMIKISFIILKIQDFTKDTIVNHKDDNNSNLLLPLKQDISPPPIQTSPSTPIVFPPSIYQLPPLPKWLKAIICDSHLSNDELHQYTTGFPTKMRRTRRSQQPLHSCNFALMCTVVQSQEPTTTNEALVLPKKKSGNGS